MTHAAIVFRLSDLATGRVIAEAIVCAPVRHAAIRHPGADRLSHPHALAATWKEIDAELSVGLPSSPLAKFSAIVTLLVPQERRSSVAVRYLVGVPVETEPAPAIAERLDAEFAKVMPPWIVEPAGPSLSTEPRKP
jgi:hypothetical protein